mgnify:CR=1 FL=1
MELLGLSDQWGRLLQLPQSDRWGRLLQLPQSDRWGRWGRLLQLPQSDRWGRLLQLPRRNMPNCRRTGLPLFICLRIVKPEHNSQLIFFLNLNHIYQMDQQPLSQETDFIVFQERLQ